MRLLVVELAPNAYRVTVRDDAGNLVARVTGPPAFCLEQVAAGLASPAKGHALAPPDRPM
jgi:hypothetical protein